MSRGRSRRILTPRSYDPCIGLSQAPERTRGRVGDMREEKVELNVKLSKLRRPLDDATIGITVADDFS
jgi:hypothetical protein